MSFYIGWRVRRSKAEELILPPRGEELRTPPKSEEFESTAKESEASPPEGELNRRDRGRSDPTDETGRRSDLTENERRS